MKKRKLWWLMGLVLVFLLAGAAGADDFGTTDYEYTGVLNEDVVRDRVENILQVTNHPGDDWAQCWGANPWREDGQYIVYTSSRSPYDLIPYGEDVTPAQIYEDTNEICVMKADGTDWQQLTHTGMEPSFYIPMCNSHASFVPNPNPTDNNPRKIVFQRGDWESGAIAIRIVDEYVPQGAEIWIMNDDGSDKQSLTRAHGGPVCDGCSSCDGSENKPVVSPDGTMIAFRSCSRLYVMAIDGSNPREVAPYGGCAHHTWSPDSQWVLFDAPSEEQDCGRRQIYKVRPDGSDLTQLTSGADYSDENFLEISGASYVANNWAFWSPNGEWIAFHSNFGYGNDDGPSTLSIMRPDGSDKRVLVSSEDEPFAIQHNVCGPKSWSPDSQWIAFKKRYVLDEFTPLSDDILGESQSLYYGWEQSHIFVIRVSTGEALRLTEGFTDRRLWWSPSRTDYKILFRDQRNSYSAVTRDYNNYRDLLVMNLDTDFFKMERIDWTNDGTFTMDDWYAIERAYGTCKGHPDFIPEADYNFDGCFNWADWSYGALFLNWW